MHSGLVYALNGIVYGLPAEEPVLPYSFASLKAGYTSDLARMTVRPSWKARFAAQAAKVLKGRQRYENFIANNDLKIPWQVIGIIHLMEGDCNWGTYLGNGQSLSRPTTMVPRGRGPFPTWEKGALDAIKLQKLNAVSDWPTEYVCWMLEAYNGFGYRSHGVPSPYLWSGTSIYSSGKFVVDGGYVSSAVSQQAGAIPIYLELLTQEKTAMADSPIPVPPVAGSSIPVPPVADSTAGVNVSTSRIATAMSTISVGSIVAIVGPLLSYLNPTETSIVIAILTFIGGAGLAAANGWSFINFNNKSSNNTTGQLEYWSGLAQGLAKELAAAQGAQKTAAPPAPPAGA